MHDLVVAKQEISSEFLGKLSFRRDLLLEIEGRSLECVLLPLGMKVVYSHMFNFVSNE